MSSRVKTKIKAIYGRAAGLAGVYARAFRDKATIVTFHRVSDQMPEDGLTCGAAKFEAFGRFFRKYFEVLPLSEMLARCIAGRDLGGTLAITFDDGYLNNAEIAAPILRKLGLPATFFVTTGFIGSKIIAPWDREQSRPPGWMEWAHVRALLSQGFEIGNHTDTHPDLGKVGLSAIRSELEVSQRKFERELGVAPRLFAYPFGGIGNFREEVLPLVHEAGFQCCASCYGGLNGRALDPFGLKRIPIAGWFREPHQFGFEFISGRLNRPFKLAQ